VAVGFKKGKGLARLMVLTVMADSESDQSEPQSA